MRTESGAWEGLKVVLHPGYVTSWDAKRGEGRGYIDWIHHRDLTQLYGVPSSVPTQVCHACDVPNSPTICVEKGYSDPSTIHLFPRERGDYAEWLKIALETKRTNRSYDSLKKQLPTLIGDQIVAMEDGSYCWFATEGKGGWSAWSLRVIASHLNELESEGEKA